MTRRELIFKAYNHVSLLTIDRKVYSDQLDQFTGMLLAEDLGDRGDITTDSVLMDINPQVTARLIAKSDGICAGIEESGWFYRKNKIDVECLKKDGDKITTGESLMILKGTCHDLLTTERVGLNFLQRMCGIATLTDKLRNRIDENDLYIAATRKTPCGVFDKKAVAVAGGLTHRLGLWDSILIKDNHLTILQQNGFQDNYIRESLNRAHAFQPEGVVEIEVKNKVELQQAIEGFMDLMGNSHNFIGVILLDNFDVQALKSQLAEIKPIVENCPIIFEASGNITPDTISTYASAGVDVVSLGYLTHSAAAFDISQLHD